MMNGNARSSSLHALPTAEELVRAKRLRMLSLIFLDLLIASAVAGAYTAFDRDDAILPVVLLFALITPMILWRWPRMSLYALFACVCLLELFPTGASDALTDRVPFFWNINTIIQVYGNVNFKAIPLNLMEVFILTAGACSLFRSVYMRTTNLRVGSLFWPIMCYMIFVLGAWGIGMTQDGDFKISLQEVRSQFYFLLAYLMAINIIRDRAHVVTLLWIFVWCVGLKGILYTFRRYVTMAGMDLPDQGVGSHEEAFFFSCFQCLLLVLLLTGTHRRMQIVMWTLLPLVLIGDLACNRRAGTAAIVIAIPIMFMAAYKVLPERRRLVAILSIVVGTFGMLYYNAFKNSDSLIAKPARAIHSQFAPDARDASSNAYRDAENADLYATIKSAPILGYGYGRRMIHAVPIADISKQYEWWDILTHNQILWVWMRVGTLGFIAFWMMVCAILVRACLTIRSETADNEIKAYGIFTMMIIGMLLIFGLLDLQLSNFRDMIFAGCCTGILAAMPTFASRLVVAPIPNQTTSFPQRTSMRMRTRPRRDMLRPVPDAFIASEAAPALETPTESAESHS